ncbi:MAG: hypothetical protein AAF772_19220 [Acidobacteriota bacterium]
MTDTTPSAGSPIVEIVRVRCTAATFRDAEASLRALCAAPGGHAIRLLRSASAPHDLGLHLRSTVHAPHPIGASPLGLRIAASLRDFGSVSHSVWLDIAHPSTRQENPT